MSDSPAVPRPSGEPTSGTRLGSAGDGRLPATFAVDVVAVVLFSLLGRVSHAEDLAPVDSLITMWPFLVGLVVGWLVLLARHMRPLGYPAAFTLVACGIAIGMLLRHTVSHDGTPVGFVIAASTFQTILLVGWRAVARYSARRAAASSN